MATMKKMKSGGKSSLGMKSVKAGYDKNPGVTRADIIVAAKKEAKKGAKIKKAQTGLDVPKGYVRGEMTGKLYKKADMEKHKNEFARALDEVSPWGSKAIKQRAAEAAVAKKAASKKAVPKKATTPSTRMKSGGSVKGMAKCRYGCK